ncbi:pyridoxine 5'-phosphate synthase [Aestuariivirga sp.]|uniref:pyridoxine 5'-phosphate synthase n=1 Tax=Aestuariivirga sp. TaxID=2650926 RepID=UPI00378430B5
MPCNLSVNVNAIAYLRNRRGLPWPSVYDLSKTALEAGAAGITVHPRPDERHIRRDDVTVISRLLREEFPDAEFNIEGYPDDRFLDLVEEVRPDQVTLVPDEPGQVTSDHGWNIASNRDRLRSIIARLHCGDMRVALFVDADPALPGQAREVGADRVEIFTGPYGGALVPEDNRRELDKVIATGRAAAKAGIGLNAGHDLTRDNLPPLVAALPNLQEVSIGHAVTADALVYGMAETVRKFRAAIGDL